MKYLILIPLLCNLAFGQTVCYQGASDSTHPFFTKQIPCEKVPHITTRKEEWREFSTSKHESWVSRHPTKTKVLFVIGGTAIGSIVAYKTKLGSCAKFYDGKPYSGTPPCPK